MSNNPSATFKVTDKGVESSAGWKIFIEGRDSFIYEQGDKSVDFEFGLNDTTKNWYFSCLDWKWSTGEVIQGAERAQIIMRIKSGIEFWGGFHPFEVK